MLTFNIKSRLTQLERDADLAPINHEGKNNQIYSDFSVIKKQCILEPLKKGLQQVYNIFK